MLDMLTPGISGAELIAHLRGTGLATIPMVLMTAVPQEAAPLLEPGLIECLAKPFDLDDLLACVARFVQPTPAVAERPVRYVAPAI
jgi:CheY-like chemotaxis protein